MLHVIDKRRDTLTLRKQIQNRLILKKWFFRPFSSTWFTLHMQLISTWCLLCWFCSIYSRIANEMKAIWMKIQSRSALGAYACHDHETVTNKFSSICSVKITKSASIHAVAGERHEWIRNTNDSLVFSLINSTLPDFPNGNLYACIGCVWWVYAHWAVLNMRNINDNLSQRNKTRKTEWTFVGSVLLRLRLLFNL